MKNNFTSKVATYTATITVLGGGGAQAAVIYQNLNQLVYDPDPEALNGNTHSIFALRFNGAAVTFDHTSAGGAATFNAIEQSSGKAPSVPTIFASGGYVQTPGFVNAGDIIGNAFTQTGTTMNFAAGSGTNLFLGVSTPTHNYGWVRFSYTEAGKTITVHDAAFQSQPYELIAAGATSGTGTTVVPETSVVTLAALAGGLAVLRRRRSIA